jgi:AcrR family transcriptional regulator
MMMMMMMMMHARGEDVRTASISPLQGFHERCTRMKTMPSITEVYRPVPQQKRSSKRVAEYLEIAAHLFADVGYEAATMTAIAERAGSSIGGLYRYFPDKRAIGVALQEKYSADFDEVWTGVIAKAENLSVSEFSGQLLDRMSKFVSERPGYFTLLAAPIKYRRDAASRRNVRTQFSKAFVAKNPALSQEDALLAANVAIQIVKGMVALCAEVEPRRRTAVVREFKRAMTNYLADVLRSN